MKLSKLFNNTGRGSMKHLSDIYEGMFDDDFEPISDTTARVYELCQSLSCIRSSGNNFVLGVKDMKGFEDALKKLGTKIKNPSEYDPKDLKKDEILLFNFSETRNKKQNGAFIAVFLNDNGWLCNMGLFMYKWSQPKPTLASSMASYIHNAYPLYIAKGKDEIIKAIQHYWTEIEPPKHK